MLGEKKYKSKFHLMASDGWINDPNGLCQLNGIHHIFFQYSPNEAYGGIKKWGHFETNDFITYKFSGVFLEPDIKEDKDGVYSGSTFVKDDTMYIYYTGNVKLEGDYDYIHNGREGNTIMVTSKDGINPSKKECLLKNEDYPNNISNHVRDPKVFENGNMYYMVLGARTNDDKGCVLLYQSKDLKNWQFKHIIIKENCGYMWECPDLFVLDKKEFLSVSLQGVARCEYKHQNVYSSGYFTTKSDIIKDGNGLKEYYEWDYGFDFYAPQTYIDKKGRRILIGWMGVPDAEYGADPTVDEGWQHMLTLPRKLSLDKVKKTILQTPIEEIDNLRKDILFKASSKEILQALKFVDNYELLLSNFDGDDFKIIFNQGFILSYDKSKNVCTFEFINEKLGHGRTKRKIKLLDNECIENMRIFMDISCIEIYINDGAYVFTSKLFKDKNDINTVMIKGQINDVLAYSLDEFIIKNM